MPGEEPEDIFRHLALVVALERSRRIPEAVKVGGDHRMARPGERRHHMAPLAPDLGPAVQEIDGRPLAEAGSGGGVARRLAGRLPRKQGVQPAFPLVFVDDLEAHHLFPHGRHELRPVLP